MDQVGPPCAVDCGDSRPSGWINLTWEGNDKRAFDEILTKAKISDEKHNLVEAQRLYWTAYQGYAHLLGHTNERTLEVVRLYDQLCQVMNTPTESEQLLGDTIVQMRKKFGKDHPKTLSLLEAIAANYQSQNRHGDSEVVLGHVLEAYKRVYSHKPAICFERSKQPILLLAKAHVNQCETDRAKELLLHTLIIGKILTLEDDDSSLLKQLRDLMRSEGGKSNISETFLLNSLHKIDNEHYLTVLIVFLEFWEENFQDDCKPSSMQRFLLLYIGKPSQQCDQYRQLAKRLTDSGLRSGNYRLIERFRLSMQDKLDHEIGECSIPALSNLTRTGDLYHHQLRWEDAKAKFQEGLERCKPDPSSHKAQILDMQSCLQSISERTPLTEDCLLARC